MRDYADYCPIAMANEIVGDRWNPLVLRELMVGARHFNDIHRGIPRISRTLLAGRLRSLERHGLVERRPVPGSQAVDYLLTDAGRDLQPILWQLGRWATRWTFGDPPDDVLDTHHLVWRLHQVTDPACAPQQRTTVEILTRGPGSARCWMVFARGESTACQIDPGYDVDLVLRADNRELHRWFMGRTTWPEARRAGTIELSGPAGLAAAFPTWFRPNPFHADVRAALGQSDERPAAGAAAAVP